MALVGTHGFDWHTRLWLHTWSTHSLQISHIVCTHGFGWHTWLWLCVSANVLYKVAQRVVAKRKAGCALRHLVQRCLCFACTALFLFCLYNFVYVLLVQLCLCLLVQLCLCFARTILFMFCLYNFVYVLLVQPCLCFACPALSVFCSYNFVYVQVVCVYVRLSFFCAPLLSGRLWFMVHVSV
jgi:hypothetical protein